MPFNFSPYVVLPTPLNESGPRIIFARFTFDPKEYKAEDTISYSVAQCELLLVRDPQACIQGTLHIIDFAEIKAGHIMNTTLSVIKRLIMYYEKSLPLRIKGVCGINVSTYAQQIFKMALQHTSEKIKQRVSIFTLYNRSQYLSSTMIISSRKSINDKRF